MIFKERHLGTRYTPASPEKLHSRALVSGGVRKMMEKHPVGRLITMPANVGVHENQLIDMVHDCSRERNVSMDYQLVTVCREHDKDETGVIVRKPELHHVDRTCFVTWWHCRGEILQLMLAMDYSIRPTAVWLDLCGGLHEENVRAPLEKLCKGNFFPTDSQIWLTLQVYGARRLTHPQAKKIGVAEQAYRKSDDAGYRIKVTDKILQQTIGKPVRVLCEPYMYMRRHVVYGVFGYEIQ